MKKKDDNTLQLEKVAEELINKYLKQKNEIVESLSYTEDEEERYSIRRNAEKLRNTLLYMPPRVNERIAPELNALLDSYRHQDLAY